MYIYGAAGSNGSRLAISLPIRLSLGTIWLSLVNVYGELTAHSSMVDGAWVRLSLPPHLTHDELGHANDSCTPDAGTVRRQTHTLLPLCMPRLFALPAPKTRRLNIIEQIPELVEQCLADLAAHVSVSYIEHIYKFQ